MMATKLDSKRSVYGWMDKDEYEDLYCHVTKNCFCNEFTVEGHACPDIELVCWRHDKMDKKCDACVLVDYLNPIDVSLWRTSLSRLKCNMLRCPHKWVAHSCAECVCICDGEFPFIQDYCCLFIKIDIKVHFFGLLSLVKFVNLFSHLYSKGIIIFLITSFIWIDGVDMVHTDLQQCLGQ